MDELRTSPALPIIKEAVESELKNIKKLIHSGETGDIQIIELNYELTLQKIDDAMRGESVYPDDSGKITNKFLLKDITQMIVAVDHGVENALKESDVKRMQELFTADIDLAKIYKKEILSVNNFPTYESLTPNITKARG